MALTREQLELFHNNGFLKMPGRFDPAYIEQLKHRIAEDTRNAVEPVVRDAQQRVFRLSQMYDRGGLYRETIEHPLILDTLESILGPNIVFTRNRHNHATLNFAGMRGMRWHRDILQWTRNIVTVILYLEESTVDNGCTMVVPGTHRLPVHLDTVGDLSNDQMLQRAGVFDQAMPVPMPAGGMLVINSLILHTIGDNRTNTSRMSLTMGYHGGDELYGDANPQCVQVRGEALYAGNTTY